VQEYNFVALQPAWVVRTAESVERYYGSVGI